MISVQSISNFLKGIKRMTSKTKIAVGKTKTAIKKVGKIATKAVKATKIKTKASKAPKVKAVKITNRFGRPLIPKNK